MKYQFNIKDLGAVVFIILAFLLLDWICPFQAITGIPCPGCMMTTAFYYLIQLDLETALYFNPAILVILMALILLFLTRKNKKRQTMIFWIMIGIWIAIYLIRMITVFPDWPMEYQRQSLLGHLLGK